MKLLIRQALITMVAALFGRAVASCAEACRLTCAARDRRLTRRERVSIRVHNFLCRECGRYAGQVNRLCACAKEEPPLPPLPDSVKKRMADALRDDDSRPSPRP